MSIKKGVDYNGLVRNGSSLFHQNRDFPFRATQSLLSLNPMSESVKQ